MDEKVAVDWVRKIIAHMSEEHKVDRALRSAPLAPSVVADPLVRSRSSLYFFASLFPPKSSKNSLGDLTSHIDEIRFV